MPEPTSKDRVTLSMQRPSLMAAALIAGLLALLLAIYVFTGRGSQNTNNDRDEQAPRQRQGKPSEAMAGENPRKPVQTADLTGHYEARADGAQRARMCMISDPSGLASFGIITETRDGGGCGGAGKAVREANVLRLTMAGEGDCVIKGTIARTQVRFPQGLAKGCSYYCAPGASLAGAIFEKTGGTAADARRAVDLAGDPLCE